MSQPPEPAPSAGVHLLVVGQREGVDDALLEQVWRSVRPRGGAALDVPKRLREPFRRYRCRSPDELVDVVRDGLNRGERVSTLDLFDHGSAGQLRILDGDVLTFEPDPGGEGTFQLGEGFLVDARGRARTYVEQLASRLVERAGARLPWYQGEYEEAGRRLVVNASGWLGIDRVADYLTEDARVRLLGCRTACGEAGRQMLIEMSERLGARRVVYGTIHNIVATDFDEGGFLAAREQSWLYSSEQAKACGVAPTMDERMAGVAKCK